MKKLLCLICFLPFLAAAQPLLRNTATTNQSPFNANQFNDASGTTITIKSAANITNLNGWGGWNMQSGSLSFLGNANYTASTMLQLDALQVLKSVANGTGALTNNGSGTFGWFNSFATLPANAFGVLTNDGSGNNGWSSQPAVNLQQATNLFGQYVVYSTNASDSVTMPVGKYTLLVTNNNITLANNFLSGAQYANTNVNWSVLMMTNTTATAKTISTPASLQMSGSTGAQTLYVTNLGILSVMGYGNSVTVGVYRSFP